MKYIHRRDIYTILRYFGIVMMVIGAIYLVPIPIDLIFLEFKFYNYLIVGGISIAIGYLLYRSFESKSIKLKLQHAMIISTLSWIWAAICGSLIMMLYLKFGFISGVFENLSALTGTGITLFNNVEALPYSILFLRSLEQWVGGLGVVIMVIGFLMRPGVASAKLYQIETNEEKIKPSSKHTLKQTVKIYLIFTISGIILFIIAGMPIFDSICNTFTCISTGGMGIKNANMGYYNNNLIYLIAMILMIIGATSFLVHYKIIKTKGKSLIQDIQFKVLITTIAIISIIIYLTSYITPMENIFTVVSAITTCGASINNPQILSSWPPFTLILLMILMTIGGSSGSTSGAIKLPRIIIFFKGLYKTMKEIVSPEGRIITVKHNGKKISDETIKDAGNFITLYLMFLLAAWAIFCLYGYDPFKSLFAVVTLQGNTGLDLGILNGSLNPFLQIVSIITMLIGRLEIYPMIICFTAIYDISKNILKRPKKYKY